LFGYEHAPVAGLHTPGMWHASPPPQSTALPAVQTPPWHVSLCVQALPSLQLVPFGLFGFEHAPVAGLHTPGMWHASPSPQSTGAPPVQTPPWHVSVCVQALPSLHPVPFGLFGFEHMPVAGLQDPAPWH
jgi:hypothetical protein